MKTTKKDECSYSFSNAIRTLAMQTMAGREQKAREGKWNGGFAPYNTQQKKAVS